LTFGLAVPAWGADGVARSSSNSNNNRKEVVAVDVAVVGEENMVEESSRPLRNLREVQDQIEAVADRTEMLAKLGTLLQQGVNLRHRLV